MHDNHRAADDVAAISARLQELQARKPRRHGSQYDHCDHCPAASATEACILGCEAEAKKQGWYLPELFP